jgi:hypothetical protein
LSYAKQALSGYLDAIARKVSIIYNEGFAVVVYVLLYAIDWWLRRQFSFIAEFSLTLEKTHTTAYLYFHGEVTKLTNLNRYKGPAVVLLHADQSHPSTMLHLANIAQKTKRPVFSLYIPYDDAHPERSFSLVEKAMEDHLQELLVWDIQREQ